MKWGRVACLIGCGMLMASYGQACELTVSQMIFGDYIPADTQPLRATASIEVICPRGVRYRVRALEGKSAKDFLPRRLTHSAGNDTLSYNLYVDPLGREIWGDGTRGTGMLTGSGDGLGQTHFVHGIIFPKQRAPSGHYSDVVQIIVEW